MSVKSFENVQHIAVQADFSRTVVFHPSWNNEWLTPDLIHMVNGVMGIALILSVSTLIIAGIMLIVTKMTATKWDDRFGWFRLISVCIGVAFLASLGGGVQWAMQLGGW